MPLLIFATVAIVGLEPESPAPTGDDE